MGFSGFLGRFFQLKWRLANNQLTSMRRYMWVHCFVALVVLVLLVGGGTWLFKIVFDFLESPEQMPWGRPLMNRLVRMVLLTFLSMLIFSNLIIMLTTTYISREVEFLMSNPIGHRRLFFGKLGESILYSSWAFVILSLPFFAALGRSRNLDAAFYLGSVVLIIPYLIIPATLGAAVALVVTAIFPPRQMIRLAVALALLGGAAAIATRYMYGFSAMLEGAGSEGLSRLMRWMGVGDVPLLPSGWLGRGLLALENTRTSSPDWGAAGFWALALWSTAAMGLVVCDWLAGPLYYRGWCNSRTSGSTQRNRKGGLYVLFDRCLAWIPRGTRAMLTKDLTIFWRDPAQWGQLMILFGLLFIYLFNLRSAMALAHMDIFVPKWQSLISMFNIGATAFVLSILTTRFVYPMLSLEGRQQWVIGLAPVRRTHLVWEKFSVSVISAMAVTLPLATLSCLMLRTEWFVTGLSILTVLVLSGGLSSLAVGLGAMMPNFLEDNPSRIANGVGGTLNAVTSLIYIGLTLALQTPWVWAYIAGVPERGTMRWTLLVASIPCWIALHLAMFSIPLAMGLIRWRRLEF